MASQTNQTKCEGMAALFMVRNQRLTSFDLWLLFIPFVYLYSNGYFCSILLYWNHALMGRHHRTQTREKHKITVVSEVEERERIKENILKVFRARLTSPNEGGALLVGPDKISSRTTYTTKAVTSRNKEGKGFNENTINSGLCITNIILIT